MASGIILSAANLFGRSDHLLHLFMFSSLMVGR